MKLGAENKRMVILASSLGVLAVVMVIWQFGSSSAPPPPPAHAGTAAGAAAPSSSQPGKPMRAKFGGPGKHTSESLDPRLRFGALKLSENIKYEGTGRNIFTLNVADIPPTNGGGLLRQPSSSESKPPTWTPPIIEAPKINLKFFGWASQPGEPKAIFLSQGENVFVAHEGETIARRYRIGKIGLKDVEIEDVLYKNLQRIPLTENPS